MADDGADSRAQANWSRARAAAGAASGGSPPGARRRGGPASGERPPAWVPDSTAKACMLCETRFTMTTRRHHCRSCGKVVCGACSAHELVLPFAGPKAVRVCGPCHERETGDEARRLGAAVSGGGRDVRLASAAREADPRMEPPALAPWLYALKPLTEAGRTLPIGRVLVRCVEAADLPPMDIRTSDPYCTIHVGEARPDRPAKTSVRSLTLQPKWDEEFILPVHNATSALYVEVFDHDSAGPHDKIGTVRVPLESLSHQSRFESWYDLELAPKAAARLPKGATPAVRLELHYTFSKVGEFFSQFSPDLPPAPPADAFDTNLLYGEFFRFLEHLTPVFNFVADVNTVLGWERPLLSFGVLAAFVAVVWHPWALPVLLQLLLLRHVAWNFVHREWNQARRREAEAARSAGAGEGEDGEGGGGGGGGAGAAARALFGRVRRPFRSGGPSQGESADAPPEDEHRMYELNGMMTRMINASLDLAGWEEWLQWYQNMFKWMSDLIEAGQATLDWSSPGTTGAVAAALVATTLYSVFVTFQHIALVLGVYVLCAWTLPVQATLWAVAGVARYFGRARTRKAVKHARRRRWHATVDAAVSASRRRDGEAAR